MSADQPVTPSPPGAQGAAEGLSNDEYFAAMAELQGIDFELRKMHERVSSRSPIDAVVDQASGHEAHMTADAEALIARAAELKELIGDV